MLFCNLLFSLTATISVNKKLYNCNIGPFRWLLFSEHIYSFDIFLCTHSFIFCNFYLSVYNFDEERFFKTVLVILLCTHFWHNFAHINTHILLTIHRRGENEVNGITLWKCRPCRRAPSLRRRPVWWLPAVGGSPATAPGSSQTTSGSAGSSTCTQTNRVRCSCSNKPTA